MTSGDFAIGLMTIITGLAIADMVASTHALLMNRRRVRWDWLAVLTATYIFLLIVSSWGISFRTLGNQPIDPPLWLFVIGLSQIIPLYLAARSSLPDEMAEKGVSLAAHYAKISRYFWASVAMTYFVYLGYAAYANGAAAFIGAFLSPSAQFVMMLVLGVVPARRVHALLVPVIVALFCYDHLMSPMFA